MNRTIVTERRYPIKDYAYLHLVDSLDSVPEHLALNPEFGTNVRFLQLVNMEMAYRNYLSIVRKAPHSMAVDEALAVLEELRLDTLKKLHIIQNGEENDDE